MTRGLVDWRLMGKMEKQTKVKSPTGSPKAIYGCGSSGAVDLRVRKQHGQMEGSRV